MSGDTEGPEGPGTHDAKDPLWLKAVAFAIILFMALVYGAYGVALLAPIDISFDPFTLEIGK